jgi:hypothetical protein
MSVIILATIYIQRNSKSRTFIIAKSVCSVFTKNINLTFKVLLKETISKSLYFLATDY